MKVIANTAAGRDLERIELRSNTNSFKLVATIIVPPEFAQTAEQRDTWRMAVERCRALARANQAINTSGEDD